MANPKNPLKKVKDTLAVRTRARRLIMRQGSEFIVFESTISLIFFSLAFLVFLPLLNKDSDWLKILVSLYGIFVIVWGFSVIYDYFIKASRLLASNVHNYSLLSGLNSILGLAVPLFIINSLTSIVVTTLGSVTNYGTAICEIRLTLVRFYRTANIYNQVSSLIFWILVFSLGVMIVGGLLEKTGTKRK